MSKPTIAHAIKCHAAYGCTMSGPISTTGRNTTGMIVLVQDPKTGLKGTLYPTTENVDVWRNKAKGKKDKDVDAATEQVTNIQTAVKNFTLPTRFTKDGNNITVPKTKMLPHDTQIMWITLFYTFFDAMKFVDPITNFVQNVMTDGNGDMKTPNALSVSADPYWVNDRRWKDVVKSVQLPSILGIVDTWEKIIENFLLAVDPAPNRWVEETMEKVCDPTVCRDLLACIFGPRWEKHQNIDKIDGCFALGIMVVSHMIPKFQWSIPKNEITPHEEDEDEVEDSPEKSKTAKKSEDGLKARLEKLEAMVTQIHGALAVKRPVDVDLTVEPLHKKPRLTLIEENDGPQGGSGDPQGGADFRFGRQGGSQGGAPGGSDFGFGRQGGSGDPQGGSDFGFGRQGGAPGGFGRQGGPQGGVVVFSPRGVTVKSSRDSELERLTQLAEELETWRTDNVKKMMAELSKKDNRKS